MKYNKLQQNPDSPTTHSITTERMMAEKVQLDTFKPPHHKLKQNIKSKLMELLKEYNSQFAQDETTIVTTPLTEMTIDTGTSEPVSQKPYPIAIKHNKWVKDETPDSKNNTRKSIKLVSTHHSGCQG